jgi:hypothetical protein
MAFAPDITAVIGPKAAGKTALLHGLSKLVTRAQRTMQRSDFHVAPDADPDDRSPKTLFIDALVVLPELADGTATPETVAPTFRHMLLTRKDRPPVCRLRLEARWEDDGTVEGEVSQELYWMDSLEPIPARRQEEDGAVGGSPPHPALLDRGEPRRGRAGAGHRRRAGSAPAPSDRMVGCDGGRDQGREWTWRTFKNGFRIDHAFGNPEIVRRFQPACRYDHTPRGRRFSDHSALLITMAATPFMPDTLR